MATERTPQYFYMGGTPTKIKSAIKPSLKIRNNNKSDLYNPIFNMDKSFGEKFAQIKPTDAAQSQPFISLKIVDLNGKTVSDLNVNFFQKQIDFNAIKGAGRYTDRPLISLKNVEISSEQSSGFFYFTNVILSLKIHKKDELSDGAVLGLLFPGCPLLMEYGWNSKDEWLNTKQTLLLNIVNYDITLDESGQADLTVKCMAYNNVVENVLIGDLNTLASSNDNVSEQEQNGLHNGVKTSVAFIEYINGLEKNKTKGTNDYSVVVNSAKVYKNLETRTRGKISENFSRYLKNLSEAGLRRNFSLGGKKGEIQVVSLYDVIFALCHDTFISMSALVPVKTFEIIYGSFNDQCLDYSGKSIADFPIDYNKFISWVRDQSYEGARTVTVKNLLDSLCSLFIENEDTIRGFSKSQAGVFQLPRVCANLHNDGDILILSIVDAHTGVPPTTNQIKDLKKASLADAQQKILNGTDIPIITLGNSNSFIKNVTFSRIDDDDMESLLIKRSYDDSQFNPRSGVINSKLENSQAVKTPLSLPLQGSARVMGHVGWKRLSSFYLSTGIFLIDAIYIITKVSHSLSAEGFETQIEFIWH